MKIAELKDHYIICGGGHTGQTIYEGNSWLFACKPHGRYCFRPFC